MKNAEKCGRKKSALECPKLASNASGVGVAPQRNTVQGCRLIFDTNSLKVVYFQGDQALSTRGQTDHTNARVGVPKLSLLLRVWDIAGWAGGLTVIENRRAWGERHVAPGLISALAHVTR